MGYFGSISGSWTPTSGFSQIFSGSCPPNSYYCWAYSTSLSSASTFPITAPQTPTYGWAEAAVAFLPTVTVPINLGIQGGASTDSASVTCNGGGGTYTTTGGTQDFICNPSVTVSLSLTAGGTNNRWCFSGACTISESWTSCSSGTCSTQSYNYWEQYSQSVAYSVTCASGTCNAPTLTYYQSGSITHSTLSTSANTYWIDQGSIASVSINIADSANDEYTPYFSSWLINGVNVIDTPIVYWEGL